MVHTLECPWDFKYHKRFKETLRRTFNTEIFKTEINKAMMTFIATR